MNIKEMIEKFNRNFKEKNGKNVGNLIIIFLIGILLLIAGTTLSNKPKSVKTINQMNLENKKEENTKDTQKLKEEETLKNELKNTLSKMEGVGRVEVMIYFESGEEKIPAVNITDSTNTSKEADNEGGKRDTTQKNTGTTVVVTNDGGKSEPFIIKTYKPKVTGVFIVAEGAENKTVEYKITKAVMDLFNIQQNKVNVYPMKK